MPIQPNFKEYHKSIAHELDTVKDRIRYLIGDRHWQSDGEHNEAILRKVLRNHLAQMVEVGRGFVCAEHGTSSQIDILIIHRNKPTLFREGETLLVTPDAVAAIIEVKTRVQNHLNEVLGDLAENAELVRKVNPACVVGLFAFEPLERQDAHIYLLQQVQQASNGSKDRVVNLIAAGPDIFVRYWEDGSVVSSPVDGAVWHSYKLKDLSHAYFVSNAVWETCPDPDYRMRYAWFPIEGGKESHRQYYIPLNGGQPRSFSQEED